MLWVPQKGRPRMEHNYGTVGSTTYGTSVTTGGTSATKGTPAQVFAASAFDAYLIAINAHSYGDTNTNSAGALDILVGGATEDILIPNLLFGQADGVAAAGTTTHGFGRTWLFPLYIPAGTRIAVQAAGERTSTALRVGIALYGGDGMPPFRVGRKVTTYGMGTVPNGTAITPGASGAAGSHTQMTAATSEDHFAVLPSFQVQGDSSISRSNYNVGIGVGAATEDEVAQWMFNTHANEIMVGPYPNMPHFIDIPSGTRLTMRVSNSSANDAGYGGVIHAVS